MGHRDGLATYNIASGEHDVCKEPFRCYVRTILYHHYALYMGTAIFDLTQTWRRCFIIVALTGALFAYLIGAIANLLNFKDSIGPKFIHASLQRLRKFLTSRNVSRKAADRMSHMLLAWQQCGDAIVDGDVSNLSPKICDQNSLYMLSSDSFVCRAF